MCTDAYREALTRAFSSTPALTPAPAPAPSQRPAAEADRADVAERLLRRSGHPRQDDAEPHRPAGGGREFLSSEGIAAFLGETSLINDDTTMEITERFRLTRTGNDR